MLHVNWSTGYSDITKTCSSLLSVIQFYGSCLNTGIGLVTAHLALQTNLNLTELKEMPV
jgi:muramoyltetrapeptide carboxypeptidase LdcA involved in peptidoglycan recycling